jgi:hypothetical protein
VAEENVANIAKAYARRWGRGGMSFVHKSEASRFEGQERCG